jgi:RHS repeat-associated protein
LAAINYSDAALGDLTYTWTKYKNKTSESIGGVMSGYGFANASTTYDDEDEDRLTGFPRTNGATHEPLTAGAGTSGTIHYYHRNQQYSITAVTTSAGAVAERYAYSAYGDPTILDASGSVLASSAINNRYSYTGREWDATVGLYHFRARWMSPKTGRFLGRDPIGYYSGSENFYSFVGGMCISLVDPHGLFGIFGGPYAGPYSWPWPYWGPPQLNPQPTPTVISTILGLNDNYQQYAAAHCSGKCFCTIENLPGNNIAGVEPDAIAIANGTIFDPGSFDDGVISPGDVEFVNGGVRLKAFPGRLHSAFRHCLAVGFLSTRLQSCSCARCLADAREMFQHHWETQGNTTLQGLYNNREGAECAGCNQNSAGFGSESSIVSCCKNKLTSGALATGGAPPIGTGGPGFPQLPPQQWPLSPSVVPPYVVWPGSGLPEPFIPPGPRNR